MSPYKNHAVGFWISIAVTTSAVYFLFLFVLHAGGLWRDETNTFNMASSSFGVMWNRLEYDSFPVFWPFIFGFLINVSGTADLFLRLLGALMGVGLIVCLWFNAFSLRYRLPLVGLSLLMFCPSIILWGCSMRAYGIGMIAACLIYTLVWKYVEECSVKNLLLLLLVCLVGVHTLFYNAVVVLICILSGSAALLLERKIKSILLMGMVGFVSAISMLIYLPMIYRAEVWSVSVKTDYTLSLFISKLHETLSPGGSLVLWAWCLVIPVALTLGGKYLMESKTSGDIKMHARLLYPFLVLLLIVPAYFIFLKKLSYVTQPWYYFVLMAIVAVSADTILGILSKVRAINNCRLISAGLLLVSALFVCSSVISMRLTNIDLLSGSLNKDAVNQDLILVYPWYQGITFNRYYRGKAPWMTIPEIKDHTVHRYDLIKKHISNPDQDVVLKQTYTNIDSTLKSGNRVFVVGEPIFPQQGQLVPVLPPAPQSQYGWQDTPYNITWCMQIGDYLLKHALNASLMNDKNHTNISHYEYANLYEFKGWKD
jgi:hypothetical protein